MPKNGKGVFMAIEKVNNDVKYTRAEAERIITDRNLSIEDKSAAINQVGEEQALEWLEVDRTEYNVDLDESVKANAREKSKNKTAEKVGYDGSKTYGAYTDLALEGAPAAVESIGIAGSIAGKDASTIGGFLGKEVGKKAAEQGAQQATQQGAQQAVQKTTESTAKKATKANKGDIITVVLTTALLAKYHIEKPNSEQHDAAVQLRDQELPSTKGNLESTQKDLEDSAQRITRSTEKAEDLNDETEETIEKDKVQLDIYEERVEELNGKKDAGVALTDDEKSELSHLTKTSMKKCKTEMDGTKKDASGELKDIKSDMKDEQSNFDDAGENIATAEGVTEYGAGFDENAKTQCKIEAVAMGANGLSAGIAGAKLLAKGGITFGATTAMGLLGMATALGSTIGYGGGSGAMMEQIGYANDIDDEIDVRSQTEMVTSDTNDMYDDELDNYVNNMDTVSEFNFDDPPDDSSDNDIVTVDTEESITTLAAKKDEDKNKKTTNNGSKSAADKTPVVKAESRGVDINFDSDDDSNTVTPGSKTETVTKKNKTTVDNKISDADKSDSDKKDKEEKNII